MNPASRLHDLLQQIFKQDQNFKIRKAIAEVFHIENQNSPEVFRAYVSIINLALEIGDRLSAVPNINTDLYSRSISNVQKQLSTTTFESNVASLKQRIKEQDLHGLEFISDVFDNIEREEAIPEEKLKEFEIRIDELIEEIRTTELEAEFSHFLVSHLHRIRTSIQNYRFFGSIGVKSSLSTVIGEIILDPRDAEKDETKKGLMRKTIDMMKDINSLLVFYRNGKLVAGSLTVMAEALKLNG